MPILNHWDIHLDTDAVLRGQGADPAILRARRPRLVEIAARALEEGLDLIRPQVLSEHYKVESIRHERVYLQGGCELKGTLLSQHLAPAKEIIVILCTIGQDLEDHAASVMQTESVRGLALYGVGSAAVEALANAACQAFELESAERGWQTTIPLSPGMIGWSVEEGQPQIFSLFDSGQIGVQLSKQAIMLPLKSLSLILGLGPKMDRQGTTCDYCDMRQVCKYQSHYAQLF